MPRFISLLLSVLSLGYTAIASAHPFHGANGFMSGVLNPLLDAADHIHALEFHYAWGIALLAILLYVLRFFLGPFSRRTRRNLKNAIKQNSPRTPVGTD